MITCNKCNKRITLLNRLRNFLKLKYIIYSEPCELKCEKCSTIYEMESLKYLKILRFFMYFFLLLYLVTYVKFWPMKIIILVAGCVVLNPLSNLIISYFVKYREIKNNQ